MKRAAKAALFVCIFLKRGYYGGSILFKKEGATMRRYQEEVDAFFNARGWSYWHPLSINGRLYEEGGELAREINHLYGDKKKRAGEAVGDAEEEIGDILYTVICLANRERCDLAWVDRARDDGRRDSRSILSALAQLAWWSGILSRAIVRQYGDELLREEASPFPEFRIEPAIGGVIRALDRVACRCEYTLENAFHKSIHKVAVRDKDRFPVGA